MQVDCALTALLADLSEPATSGTPQLVMLPTNARARRLSSPSRLVAAATGSGAPGNSTLYLQYNQPSPLSLLPCALLTAADSSSHNSAAACAAAAFDTLTGADLSSLITVQDISTITGQAKCTASLLTLGQCLPGQYTLQYTVINTAGQSASSFLLVLVETLASASFSYTFAPPYRCAPSGIYFGSAGWWFGSFSALMQGPSKLCVSRLFSLFYISNLFPFNIFALRSWNVTAVDLLTQQLLSNISAASSLAAQQLPEFGVIAPSIRSVLINSASVNPIATANGTAYLISIQMTVILVGLHSDPEDFVDTSLLFNTSLLFTPVCHCPQSWSASLLFTPVCHCLHSVLERITLIHSCVSLPPVLECLLRRRGGQSDPDARPRIHNYVLQPTGHHLLLRYHNGRDHHHGKHPRCCCQCCIGCCSNAGVPAVLVQG